MRRGSPKQQARRRFPRHACSVYAPIHQEDTVSTIDSPVDASAERLGGRIRALRQARGMTLVEVASKAGLSHPFLSQLERGLAQPSMGSLERIARALGSSQLELFAAAEDVIDAHSADEVSLVRAGEGTQGPYAEGQGRLLVHGVRRFHPMEFIGDNRAAGDFYEHDEDEFLHVLDGEIKLELDGSPTYTLGPGDSVYYKAGTLHRWSSPDGPYRLFIVKQSPQRLGNLEGT